MVDHWSKAKKPWSREITRQRYVQDDKISYEKLAVEAGKSYQAIVNWASEDKKKGESWPDARKVYLSKLRAKTEEKTLEQVSSMMSSQQAQVLAAHFEGATEFRTLAQKVANAQNILLNNNLEEAAIRGEKGVVDAARIISKALIAISKDMSLWMGVWERAAQFEQNAVNVDQYNLNLALKTVTAAGFEVKNVTQEAMKAALEAEGFKVEKVEEEDGD